MNLVNAKINANLRIILISVDKKSEARLKVLGVINGALIKLLCSTSAGVVFALEQNVIALSMELACKIKVEYD